MNRSWIKVCLSCFLSMAAMSLLALPALAAPRNDNSANATVISTFPYVDQLNTTGATLEPNEAQACPGATIGATVWYKWIPKFNTGVWADTFGSNFDTVITVLEDQGAAGFPTMACNDNALYGGVIASKTSQVNFSAIGGHIYYFEVGGSQGATGELKLSIGKLPTNDNLLDAKPIPAPFTEVTTNFGATMEKTESAGCPGQTGTLWYEYTPVSSAQVTFETSGSNFDTTVAVWEWADSDPGGITTGPASFTAVGCSDDTADKTSRLTWAAKGFDSPTGRRSYYIQVGGKSTSGILRYSISTIPLPPLPQVLPATNPPPIPPVNDPLPGFTPPAPGPVPPLPNPPGTVPPNDMFGNAMTLSSSPTAVSQSTVGTTTETSEPLSSCESVMTSTVWYSYKPSAAQSLFVDATASSFSPVLAVYKQTGTGFTGLQLVGCSSAASISRATFSWQGVKNTQYYIQLGGAAESSARSGIVNMVLGRFV